MACIYKNQVVAKPKFFLVMIVFVFVSLEYFQLSLHLLFFLKSKSTIIEIKLVDNIFLSLHH